MFNLFDALHYVRSDSVPTIRADGYTEQTADITLTCSGGPSQSIGSTIPQVNIALFYPTPVTGRLLPQANVANNISEPLLLIDEPGSGLPAAVPGFGPAEPLLNPADWLC